jgi:ribosomal protein S18 acetylase RimI-like enzyme
MDNLSIRPYQPNDKEGVINLWFECDLVVPQNNPMLDIERKLKVNPEWFLIGVLDGRVVATCMAGYEGHRGWINYLAVSPQYRRRGIATQMMEEAERKLRAAGCPKINLQVRETHEEVTQFYESIGYAKDLVMSMGKRLVLDEPHGTEQPDVDERGKSRR